MKLQDNFPALRYLIHANLLIKDQEEKYQDRMHAVRNKKHIVVGYIENRGKVSCISDQEPDIPFLFNIKVYFIIIY